MVPPVARRADRIIALPQAGADHVSSIWGPTLAHRRVPLAPRVATRGRDPERRAALAPAPG